MVFLILLSPHIIYGIVGGQGKFSLKVAWVKKGNKVNGTQQTNTTNGSEKGDEGKEANGMK